MILGIYINWDLSNNLETKPNNTTFSFVVSNKTEKYLKQYKAINIDSGIYNIDNISLVSIFIIVSEELDKDFEKELLILKEFTSKKDRKIFLENFIVHKDLDNDIVKAVWKYSIILYYSEIKKIYKERNLSMDIIEKNLRLGAEDFGLKNEYIQVGREEGMELKSQMTARIALSKGYPIEEIMDLTNMTKEEILDLMNLSNN